MSLYLVLSAVILSYGCYFLLRRRSLISKGRMVRPIQEILENPEEIKLNLHLVRTPPVSGYSLKILSHLYYTYLGKIVLSRWVLASSNLNLFANLVIPEPPSLTHSQPSPPEGGRSVENRKTLLAWMKKFEGKTRFLNSICDFYFAYESQKVTPLDVARAILTCIEESNASAKPLRAITSCNRELVLSMAEASTRRWKNGSQLSLLDGIPVSIKEDFCMDSYPCLCGTTFVPEFMKSSPESSWVKKLCEKGAVIIGVTNMPEFGTNSIGSSENSLHKQPRNPHNPDHFPGGSSSGCAVSVACNLCPVSLGADGGGSGRVPAAICGTCTLKSTHTHPASGGGSSASAFSFSAITPITSSVLDTAITLDAIGNSNPEKDVINIDSIFLNLVDSESKSSLNGLTVGVYWDWVKQADKRSVAVFQEAVEKLVSLGVVIKDIKIPELEEVRVAHVITSVVELSALISMDVDKRYDQLGPSAAVVASLGHCFSAVESINAMKQRTRTIVALKAIFEQVDIIATPTVGCAIPKITSEYLSGYGMLDGEVIGLLDMYTFLASFSGIPAVTLPIGVNSKDNSLPVGIQLMAPWYCDSKLISYAHVIETSDLFPPLKPQVLYNILKNE